MPPPPGAPGHPVWTPAAEVGTGAEMFAFGAQHDGTHLRRPIVPLEHIGDLAHHVGVDEVVRTAPDLDGGHHAGLRDADMLVTCHGSLPCPFAGLRRVRPYSPVEPEEMAMATPDRAISEIRRKGFGQATVTGSRAGGALRDR